MTYHKRTRSTQSILIKLVVSWRRVCLLWIWGHIQWKKFVARQLSQISEAITYTLSHTHGEGVFSTRNGSSSCVLFFTGTTGSFFVTLCLWLSGFIRGIKLFLGLGHLSHQPIHVRLDVRQYLSHMSRGHCFLDVH